MSLEPTTVIFTQVRRVLLQRVTVVRVLHIPSGTALARCGLRGIRIGWLDTFFGTLPQHRSSRTSIR